MSRTSTGLRALLVPALAAALWLGLPRAAVAEEYKILTEQDKIYLGIGSGAALPYRRVHRGKPLRVEVVGPRTLPLEARCVLSGTKSRPRKPAGCRVRVRLGGKVLGRIDVRGWPDDLAAFQDAAGLHPSEPGALDLEIPEGAQVLTVEVLKAGPEGVALWLGQAPAEPVGETLPMMALAPVMPKPEPKPEPEPAGKPGDGDIELVPLVVPELEEGGETPAEAAPAPPAPASPAESPPEPAPPQAPEPAPARSPEAEGQARSVAKAEETAADAILALGPKVGVLLPVAGVGGDPTWLVGAEVRLIVPGTAEMLAIGVGLEYYPITTSGNQGHTDFVLETWVLPVTASATLTPLPHTVVSPVLGAGLGAYIGSTRYKGERGATEQSGVSAAFGFYLLGGLEVDLGAGGGLLAEVRWARAVGDLGDVIRNADLGGLTVDLRYRFLF